MGINVQPFYHSVTIYFTAKRALLDDEILEMAKKGFSHEEIIEDTLGVEVSDCEPGDPADLV